MAVKKSVPASHGPIHDVAFQHHLPRWAKTLLALLLAPFIAVALMVFLYAKFAGLDDEFALVMKSYAYEISGGPINEQATEMGIMLEMVAKQTDLIEDIREDIADNQDEVMKVNAGITARVDDLSERMLKVEGWAYSHSTDSKKAFP